MKPTGNLIGSTYTNGTQERLVLSFGQQYRGGSVLYRVTAKRGGGPLKVGDTAMMSRSGFATWVREKVEVSTP